MPFNVFLGMECSLLLIRCSEGGRGIERGEGEREGELISRCGGMVCDASVVVIRDVFEPS